MAIGYGITGFLALGHDFVPQAVILGVVGTIISCSVTSVFSATPTIISGPSGPLTIVLIAIVTELQGSVTSFTHLPNQNALIIGSTALCLLIGGVLQVMLGFSRIGSIVKYVPYRTGNRFNTNKDLVGQGVGNFAAACFSAIPTSGSLVRSVANMNSGGRTRWSGVMCSLLILGTCIIARHYLGRIPLTVLSGVIIAIGFSLFDLSEFVLLRTALASNRFDRDFGINVAISLTVTVLTVAVDLILAIVVGILITTACFVVKMGKSVVRRKYCCDLVRSKRVRNLKQIGLLQQHGCKILVIELQGPIFFGSAEEVAKEIDSSNHDAEYIVIDLKRVSEIDMTGIRYMLQIHSSLKKSGKTLLISHIWENSRLYKTLSFTVAIEKIGKNHLFADLDRALEFAEDRILFNEPCETLDREYAPAEMDIFTGFSDEEIKTVESFLRTDIYGDGDLIIREGDQGRDLFMLARGKVSVRMRIESEGRERRLNTISAGVTFGEIALLDKKPRSADVVAEGDAKIYRLTYGNFLYLQQHKPNVAHKLILNMALNLSTRLRLNTEEIRVLVEN